MMLDAQTPATAPPAKGTPILPTTERIGLLDVLRGVAILAILLANITAFSQPLFLTTSPGFRDTLAPFDQMVHALREFLVSGKARSLLCILFGVGMYLQFKKRVEVPGAWPNTYFRRMGWLALIGLTHVLFIWLGDILLTYALSALFVASLVKLNEKILSVLIALGFGAALLGGGLLSVVMTVAGDSISGESIARSMILGNFLTPTSETLIYQQGPYLLHLVHRALALQAFFGNLIVLLPILGSLFLCGFLLAQRGFLKAETRKKKDVAICLLVGLGIGLPLNALPWIGYLLDWRFEFTYLIEIAGGPFLAVGIFALGCLVIPKLPKGLLLPFAKVGQTALSVYLLQSLLATFTFYSIGLGLYGKISLAQSMVIVPIIWAICILFSFLWLRWFTMGPVEWLWRTLETKTKIEIRRAVLTSSSGTQAPSQAG